MPILPTCIANQNTGFLLSTHITLGLYSLKWPIQGCTATQGMVKDLYSTASDPRLQMIPRPQMIHKMDCKWSLTISHPIIDYKWSGEKIRIAWTQVIESLCLVYYHNKMYKFCLRKKKKEFSQWNTNKCNEEINLKYQWNKKIALP